VESDSGDENIDQKSISVHGSPNKKVDEKIFNKMIEENKELKE